MEPALACFPRRNQEDDALIGDDAQRLTAGWSNSILSKSLRVKLFNNNAIFLCSVCAGTTEPVLEKGGNHVKNKYRL